MRFTEANVVQRAGRQLAGMRLASWLFARMLHRLDGPMLRRSGGVRSLTTLLTGLPIVELTTTGARSGLPRTLPIVAVPDGDRLVLVASNYGHPSNPGWYHNLTAHPRCSVTVHGQQQREMVAYEAEGAERERLWEIDLSVFPARDRYLQRVRGRRIPVMVLQPVSSAGSMDDDSNRQRA